MIFTHEEFEDYVKNSFPEVSNTFLSEHRIVEYCPNCKAKMGLQIIKRSFACYALVKSQRISESRRKLIKDNSLPTFYIIKCPECKAERKWLLYELEGKLYRMLSIPGEGETEIPELPLDPPSLRKAYAEAVGCMKEDWPMAAASMFRRTLQVITRDILGAKPGNLAAELKELKGKENRLGVKLSQDFHDNSYIIKEIGNQAAHPDRDPELLNFTEKDAKDLYSIFLDIVTELFVLPEAEKKAKENMLKRRKLIKKV